MTFYSISTVAQRTGIHESRLRRWEAMGLICPGRMRIGRQSVRMYAEEDISKLSKIKELVDDGITLQTAFNWVEGNYEQSIDA